jgi:hypothetical protein
MGVAAGFDPARYVDARAYDAAAGTRK